MHAGVSGHRHDGVWDRLCRSGVSATTSQQLIITGTGGQGILFITRLLAETAIDKGMAVLTSETRGRGQNDGMVVSHLKVGPFSSRLVRPGHADGLIILDQENMQQHRSFLKPDGWITANTDAAFSLFDSVQTTTINADTIALQLGNPQVVNLIVLGRALSTGRLFCDQDEVSAVLRRKLHDTPALLAGALAALETGTGKGRPAAVV